MKNLNVIDAINELIKATNIAYSRQAYTMAETRDIINAIEFLGDSIKNQQKNNSETPAPIEINPGPSEK